MRVVRIASLHGHTPKADGYPRAGGVENRAGTVVYHVVCGVVRGGEEMISLRRLSTSPEKGKTERKEGIELGASGMGGRLTDVKQKGLRRDDLKRALF